MPPGELTFAADEVNRDFAASLLARIAAGSVTEGDADVLITSAAPDRDAHLVVFTGPLTDDLEQWDQQVAPQTVAGALWVPQADEGADAALAWLLLRRETPTTPLSDLTDDHDRALRWSVVTASTVEFPAADPIVVDDEAVRAWADEQPQVQDLGQALERIGGDTAQTVLDSTERFRNALVDLDHVIAGLPPVGETRELANAVAEQLRQVQRSGFGKWRSGKARAEAQAATQEAARRLAAERVQALIDVRHQQVEDALRAERDRDRAGEIRAAVEQAAAELALEVQPDFDRCPRSWSQEAPAPRRYVLVNDTQAELLIDLPDVSVRDSADIPVDTAVCALVQSGFSLPAIRPAG